MNRQTNIALALVWLILAGGLVAVAIADDTGQNAPPVLRWQGKDLTGKALTVPKADRLTVMVFAKSDQDRSYQAMAEIARQLSKATDVQVIAVVSGPDAVPAAKRVLEATHWFGVMVADPDYQVSGAMTVRVWPTTVIIGKDGRQIAHLGGITSSFARELEAYLTFGRGRIDAAELQNRLQTNPVVASAPHQIAARHHEVARRLISQGQFLQARDELLKALTLQPKEAALLAELARVQVILGKPSAAMKTLDQIDTTAMPAWQLNGVRGRAMIALGKWTEARAILEKSLGLNPDPAEAHFVLAQVCAHEGQWEQAAAHYRQAFEHTAAARQLGVAPATRQSP